VPLLPCQLALRRRPRSPLFPYTTLFRSAVKKRSKDEADEAGAAAIQAPPPEQIYGDELAFLAASDTGPRPPGWRLTPRAERELRSEEHTSELQSQSNLVCRLLLEKKNDS